MMPTPDEVLKAIEPQLKGVPPFAAPVFEAHHIWQWALNEAEVPKAQQARIHELLAKYYSQPTSLH